MDQTGPTGREHLAKIPSERSTTCTAKTIFCWPKLAFSTFETKTAFFRVFIEPKFHILGVFGHLCSYTSVSSRFIASSCSFYLKKTSLFMVYARNVGDKNSKEHGLKTRKINFWTFFPQRVGQARLNHIETLCIWMGANDYPSYLISCSRFRECPQAQTRGKLCNWIRIFTRSHRNHFMVVSKFFNRGRFKHCTWCIPKIYPILDRSQYSCGMAK